MMRLPKSKKEWLEIFSTHDRPEVVAEHYIAALEHLPELGGKDKFFEAANRSIVAIEKRRKEIAVLVGDLAAHMERVAKQTNRQWKQGEISAALSEKVYSAVSTERLR